MDKIIEFIYWLSRGMENFLIILTVVLFVVALVIGLILLIKDKNG